MEVFQGCIVKLDDEGNRTGEFLAKVESLMVKDAKAAYVAMRFKWHDKVKEAGGPDKVEVLIRPFCE